MTVVSLTDRLNENSKPNRVNLENYYIDDIEVSALNFIFPYQNIKVDSIESLISQSIIRPIKF